MESSTNRCFFCGWGDDSEPPPPGFVPGVIPPEAFEGVEDVKLRFEGIAIGPARDALFRESAPLIICGACWEKDTAPERKPSFVLSPDAGIPVGEPFFPGVIEKSLERWVMRNNPLLTETRARLCDEVPMPAGRDALDEWARIWDELMRPGRPSLCPEELGDIWDGLPPDTYLGLAIERRKLHGSVWLLGPMQPVVADETDEDWGDFWQFANPILRTTELPGGAREVRQLSDSLRSWYTKNVLGLTVGGMGRPGGTATWTSAPECEAAVRDAVATWWGTNSRSLRSLRSPSQEDIAAMVHLSPRMFKEYLHRFGLGGDAWQQLRRRPT